MTKIELYKLNFENAASILEQENDQITTYENLKYFAIQNINEDMLFLAIHILEAINNDTAEYYDYDYSMGTLDKPVSLKTLEDLEDYID